ncbi:MAG: hypothetical protein ACR2I8_05560, partial [Steroidobacteraceae bacterium]
DQVSAGNRDAPPLSEAAFRFYRSVLVCGKPGSPAIDGPPGGVESARGGPTERFAVGYRARMEISTT